VLFNSIEFLVFFVTVFCVYWAVPCQRVKVILLLIASYYFYMSWNARLAAVVAGSSLIDYFLARALEGSTEQRTRKKFLITSIVMNMGLLFYFKYTNFFLQSLGDLLHTLGWEGQMPFLSVVLPIGISFYTFEAISYMVDVYMRRTEAEKNPLHFLLFITFFPRMIAGPIIRARNFLPQLKREKRFDWGRFDLGLQFVLMGLFKKIAIADRMAYLVDPVYASPGNYSTTAIWIAVVAYSLQIYCDFSGYSDIAIGTAHLLGFKLPENFNMPYLSRNITEFWQRWHISLSTWLRDYVFLSLGGSKRSRAKMSLNLMITMTLCGLWHGASWTFVAFGVVQGIMQLVHHRFRDFCKPRRKLKSFLQSEPGVALRTAVTYLSVIVFSMILFRAPDFRTAAEVFGRLLVPHRGVMVRDPVGPLSLVCVFLTIAICHVAVERGLWKKISARLTPWQWGLSYVVMLALTFIWVPESKKAFIYFQF